MKPYFNLKGKTMENRLPSSDVIKVSVGPYYSSQQVERRVTAWGLGDAGYEPGTVHERATQPSGSFEVTVGSGPVGHSVELHQPGDQR